MNLAPTDGDRAINDPISETQKLTTMTDQAGTMTSEVTRDNYVVVPALNVYPPADIEGALTRSYDVATFTWSSAHARNLELIKLEFPQLLYAIPFLRDKLKDFLYMRSRVRLEFRYVSTQYAYGELLIGWLPFYKAGFGNDWRTSDIHTLSQCNPVSLLPNSGITPQISLPWVHPDAWALITSPLPEVASVFVRVLHPLSNSSPDPPPDMTITVRAHFEDINIAGYSPGVAPATSKDVIGLARVQSESTSAPANSKMNRKDYTHNDVRNAFAAVKPVGKKPVTMQKEAEAKSSAGMLSSFMTGVSSYAPAIAMVDPGLLPVAMGVKFLADTLGPVFSAVGLNKPTSLRAVTKHMGNVDSPLSFGCGLDNPSKLSLDPEQAIATSPGICGYDSPQPTLSEICAHPTLIREGSFDNTSAAGTKIFEIPVGPQGVKMTNDATRELWMHTFASYYANWAQFWRGGFKFRLRFNMSRLMATKVRVTWEPRPITAPIATVSGDVVSTVLDCTGPTTLEVFIPYLLENFYMECTTPQMLNAAPERYANGVLRAYVYSPITSTDNTANPPVYWDVWQSTAEDFRFLQMTNCLISEANFVNSLTLPPLSGSVPKDSSVSSANKYPYAKTQCDHTVEFSKPFEGLVPGSLLSPEAALVNGEDFGTLNTMLHRYSAFSGAPGLGITYLDPHPQPNGADTFSLLIRPFLFYRGSVRFYEFNGTTASAASVGFTSASGLIVHRAGNLLSAGIALGGEYTAPLHFEVPWYTGHLFYETTPTMENNAYRTQRIAINRTTTSTLAYSAGDDFSVGCLAAPPLSVVPTLPPPEGDKIRRIRGFTY